MDTIGAPSFTKAIKWIIIATASVYVLQLLPWTGSLIRYWGSLVPAFTFVDGQVWRLFTYMFLHDTSSDLPFHILINMLILWMFGFELENLWGAKKFAIFYFICGIGSGLFSFVNVFTASSVVPVIGASGAVLGVLTANAIYNPKREILLFFVLPVNIRIFVIGYALYSVFGALVPHGNISHLTHLGGIIVAFSYLKLYPYISELSRNRSVKRDLKRRQKENVEQLSRKRFFEEQVDPILEKINREGMQSLSEKEKEILKKAASRDSERLKRNKIVPLDPFR